MTDFFIASIDTIKCYNISIVICNQHLMKMLAVRNFFSTSHLYVLFFSRF